MIAQKSLHKVRATGQPRRADASPGASPIRHRFRERREFLVLPLAQRREILKAQALSARVCYADSTEWREWERADLTQPANG